MLIGRFKMSNGDAMGHILKTMSVAACGLVTMTSLLTALTLDDRGRGSDPIPSEQYLD